MNRQTLPPMKALVRRFALPIVAAWLLCEGIWLIVLTLTQPIHLVLMEVANWYVKHFTAGSSLYETSWYLSFAVGHIVEGLIPLALGLLLGFWIRHKRYGIRQQRVR
jgi:hypothetical protein